MKITWLGEDSDHENGAGPSNMTWKGINFPVREIVEVSDPDMIRRAKGNKFFKVEEVEAKVEPKAAEPAEETKRGPGRPPKVKNGDEDQG